MAHRIAWSARAVEDVDAIASFIARDSATYAATVVRRIRGITRRLAIHPHSGRVVPELGVDSLREVLVYSYRVLYLVQDDTVTIIAVVHARRSIDGQIHR